MALKERGKIVQISDIESGVSKAGKDWRKQDFIIEKESTGNFQKFLCITCFNDKIDLIKNLSAGIEVEVECGVESREFNGKWYHNVNAFGVDPVVEEQAPPTEYTATGTPTTAFQPDSGAGDDDLPF